MTFIAAEIAFIFSTIGKDAKEFGILVIVGKGKDVAKDLLGWSHFFLWTDCFSGLFCFSMRVSRLKNSQFCGASHAFQNIEDSFNAHKSTTPCCWVIIVTVRPNASRIHSRKPRCRTWGRTQPTRHASLEHKTTTTSEQRTLILDMV